MFLWLVSNPVKLLSYRINRQNVDFRINWHQTSSRSDPSIAFVRVTRCMISNDVASWYYSDILHTKWMANKFNWCPWKKHIPRCDKTNIPWKCRDNRTIVFPLITSLNGRNTPLCRKVGGLRGSRRNHTTWMLFSMHTFNNYFLP